MGWVTLVLREASAGELLAQPSQLASRALPKGWLESWAHPSGFCESSLPNQTVVRSRCGRTASPAEATLVVPNVRTPLTLLLYYQLRRLSCSYICLLFLSFFLLKNKNQH